jgi:hypothetical protein
MIGLMAASGVGGTPAGFPPAVLSAPGDLFL